MTACGLPALGGDELTVPIDNNLGQNVIFEITELHPPADGGAMRVIAPPIVVPPGEHLVRIRSPEAEWALRRQGEDGYFDSNDLHAWLQQVETGELGAFRIIIDPDGNLSAQTVPP